MQVLKISDLCVCFENNKVIDNFSMTLNKNECVLLTGSNGSGKTTLLRAILNEIKPNNGTIIKKSDISIAYCKQNSTTVPFPISSEEVVRMSLYKNPNVSLASVEKVMKQTATWNLKDRAFFSLSGGEKQRVLLARCLCQNADLLLFDEPSSFLDSESVDEIIRILKELENKITAIVVTHDSKIIKALNWRQIKMKGGTR